MCGDHDTVTGQQVDLASLQLDIEGLVKIATLGLDGLEGEVQAIDPVIEPGASGIGLQALPLVGRQAERIADGLDRPLTVEVDVHPEQVPLADRGEVDV
jgi:hypothetical protein